MHLRGGPAAVKTVGNLRGVCDVVLRHGNSKAGRTGVSGPSAVPAAVKDRKSAPGRASPRRLTVGCAGDPTPTCATVRDLQFTAVVSEAGVLSSLWS